MSGRHKLGFFHTEPQPARDVFAAVPTPKAAIAALLPLLPPGGQSKHPSNLSPEKTSFFPFFARLCVPLLPYCSARKLFARAAAGPSSAPRRLLRPSHKQKKCGPTALRREPAHHKKCRPLAQENAHRHAWLTRSCFGRKNLFIDGPHCPFSFLLFYKGKEKRKQKQIQQVRIHRSDSLRSSSRCTRLAPRLVR